MKIIELKNAEETIRLTHSFLKDWQNDASIIEQMTSGSTGEPKPIALAKAHMKASAKLTGDFFELNKCSSSLLCISPQYIGGKMLIVRSLTYDLTLTIAPTSSNPVKDLNQPIDFAAMVPLQVATILAENPEKLNLIKYLIIGGAPVSPELEQKLQSVSCQAYATFGMTETVSHIALKRLDHKNSSYLALGNTWFETDDDLLIIHAPDLEIAALATNDCVELLSNKAFNWLGRADFVVNSGGVKLHPETIEKKISPYLPSHTFITVGIPDEKLGKKLVLITTNQDLNYTPLKNKLSTVLSPYEVPKQSYYLPKFELTASEKINRSATIAKLIEQLNVTPVKNKY